MDIVYTKTQLFQVGTLTNSCSHVTTSTLDLEYASHPETLPRSSPILGRQALLPAPSVTLPGVGLHLRGTRYLPLFCRQCRRLHWAVFLVLTFCWMVFPSRNCFTPHLSSIWVVSTFCLLLRKQPQKLTDESFFLLVILSERTTKFLLVNNEPI